MDAAAPHNGLDDQFLKTMETSRKTFASDTTLILSADGESLRYLNQSG